MAPIAVALILLACYWLTLTPTISEGDAGELATAVHTLGVAHPTGYPLFLIVGKLFDLLPLGEPAQRIALFSAVAAAAAGGVIAWLTIMLTASAAGGLLAGLAFGLNWWVWQSATQVEVYALNALFISLLMLAFAQWNGDRRPRRLHLLALLSGLALTHHRTAVFFIIPLLGWALVATRPIRDRTQAAVAGGLLAPLLLYFWLPWRSAQHPPLDWGNTSGSWAWFMQHIGGSLYAHRAFADSSANALSHTALLMRRIWLQFGVAGLGLTAVGAVALIRAPRQRALGVALAVCFLLISMWAAFYNVGDKEAFELPAVLVAALWCGVGWGVLVAAAARLKLGAALSRVIPVVGVVVAVAFGASIASQNWARADRSRAYNTLDDAATALSDIPSDAVLVLAGDQPYASALYYFYCLHPDAAPTLLSPACALQAWFRPQLDPAWRPAATAALDLPTDEIPAYFAEAVRRRLDPRRPLYTNAQVSNAPPGYVMLKDEYLYRLVAAPGLPQARDAAGARPLVSLPSGALTGVTAPREVSRGQPFAVDLAVRWQGGPAPSDTFVLSLAPLDTTGAPSEETIELRTPPVLFSAALPANRPGYHYRQTVTCLIPRVAPAGDYRLGVSLREDQGTSAAVEVGRLAVR